MVESKELFLQAYPHADIAKFSIGPNYITFNYKGMGYDVFRNKIGRSQPIHHYDDPEIEEAFQKALGAPWHAPPKFPLVFTNTKEKYPIHAADINLSLKDLRTDMAALLNPLKVFVAPKKSFTVRLPDVFREAPPGVSNVSEMSEWLSGPNIHMWDQQRNLAIWCATAGCGVAWNVLEPDTQMACFLRFHVLFTIRKLLYQLGCPPPWEGKFDYRKNFYSELASGAYYKSTHKSRNQYNWFCTKQGQGANKGCSIEAYVYCVLAAQAKTRSTIEGDPGGAIETQQVFTTLFEEAIKNDISQSIQWFQKAVLDARARLDIAISPGL
ncbi:hypothetical protein QZH41_010227 [Actinostola sp. cb2023]|nr:hypothetical protein QZH41_010227 [Actinostola sp. cb2023]